MNPESQPVRIDLGCGVNKKPGYVGLDFVEAPGVDHVLDLTKDRYPFEDASVEAVFSAHFLEHIAQPNHVFEELSRVCQDGAHIEFWMPYAFSDEASFYGHLHYMTEEEWLHFTVLHRDEHIKMLGGRWLLHRINFIVLPEIVQDLEVYDTSVEFAIKYLKGVVAEFGLEMEFQRDLATPAVQPVRSWSTSRTSERHEFTRLAPPRPTAPPPEPAAPADGRTGALRRAARRLPSPVKDKIRSLLG